MTETGFEIHVTVASAPAHSNDFRALAERLAIPVARGAGCFEHHVRIRVPDHADLGRLGAEVEPHGTPPAPQRPHPRPATGVIAELEAVEARGTEQMSDWAHRIHYQVEGTEQPEVAVRPPRTAR
jgi:hypothetical protein